MISRADGNNAIDQCLLSYAPSPSHIPRKQAFVLTLLSNILVRNCGLERFHECLFPQICGEVPRAPFCLVAGLSVKESFQKAYQK